MANDSILPVVIIGGGLAGLTAAAHLAERGIPPLVLEADRLWAGGRLSGGDPETFEHQGREWSFQPEHGVHALWGNYANMRALIARFTATQLYPSQGEEWINRWGRDVRYIEAGKAIRSAWIPAPFHYLQLLLRPAIWANIIPLDFLSLPGFLASVLLTLGVDPIKEQKVWEGLLLQEYFRGWTPNLKATFTGVATNLLAAPKEEIDLSAFIAALRFYTMLRRDAWQMDFMPHNAHVALIEPLVKYIEDHDGMVKLGATAILLEQHGDAWRIVVEDSTVGGNRSIWAQQVILALSAPNAAMLLQQSPATAAAAAQIPFPAGLRNTIIRLWFSQAPRAGTTGGMLTGDFVPDNFFWLHRLYPDYRAWHEATGGSAIEMHVYGTDELLDQPDQNLLILGVTEVQRAFPELRNSFVHGIVQRNSKVHTRWRVPNAQSLAVETPWTNIYACGDWIRYATPSLWMERSVITGMAAANAVLQANQCEPYPILPALEPELGVRGLSALLYGGRRFLGTPLMGLLKRFRQA